jgi:hypothetical protein
VGTYFSPNGWDSTDYLGMVAQAGTKYSSCGGGDSDATTDDPRWKRLHGRQPLSTEQRDYLLSLVDRGYITRVIAPILAGIIDVAMITNHNDVVVIFGRDMYPVQEVLRQWKHRLRGTWMYLEGVSRSVVHQSARWTMANLPSHTGVVYGMDTGFSGSIHLSIRLLSTDNDAYATISKGYYIASELRGNVIELEHHPKPFMRCVHTRTSGEPIMRMACLHDINIAHATMLIAGEMAHNHLSTIRWAMENRAIYSCLPIWQGLTEGEGTEGIVSRFPSINPAPTAAPTVIPINNMIVDSVNDSLGHIVDANPSWDWGDPIGSWPGIIDPTKEAPLEPTNLNDLMF